MNVKNTELEFIGSFLKKNGKDYEKVRKDLTRLSDEYYNGGMVAYYSSDYIGDKQGMKEAKKLIEKARWIADFLKLY